MPARPCHREKLSGLGLGIEILEGPNQPQFDVFFGGGKNKQENSTFGENGENVKKGLYETLKKRIVGLKRSL